MQTLLDCIQAQMFASLKDILTGGVISEVDCTAFFCIIAKSFVEFTRYLFSLPEVQEHKLAFLSNHICQDPLENFLAARGREVAPVIIQQSTVL